MPITCSTMDIKVWDALQKMNEAIHALNKAGCYEAANTLTTIGFYLSHGEPIEIEIMKGVEKACTP